ncbi:MAG: hypothetical protein ABJQ29_05130 [Luteolibacter sp.]
MSNPTAGKGTPYWYEWTVGLLKVVEMMRPDSGVSSVTFQESGVKGWDDVVVRHEQGNIEYIQVKHTREGSNLTFGGFLTPDSKGETLLGSLYEAWLEMGLSSESARCIVYTNREAGERVYLGRPPLLEFTRWLKKEALGRTTIDEFEVPVDWEFAWEEWLEKLTSGTDEARLDFFRAFSIETNRPDLKELQMEVLRDLALSFGISEAKALPLLHGLNDALKHWTDDHEKVTPEDVATALSLPDEIETLKLAPPPPVPFFPTRESEAANLERILVAADGPPVIFLCADPGAGKTSLLSRIEMRRTEKPHSGVVGLRYFSFLPITPQSQGTPSETDYSVNPERLWYSLLSQLRSDLRGKLWHYAVPVRNEILSWEQARGHVLRLADRIGRELGRKFVIVIDGIDHAARAGRLRYEPGLAFDFFRSLPGPEELAEKEIRMLVAGQPAVDYDEYPSWLKGQEEGVLKVDLLSLEKADVAELFTTRSPGLPSEEWDRAIDIITETTLGNTLAVVFAVEEAHTSNSAEDLRLRLESRRLRSGLRTYYESIWRYAFPDHSDPGGNMGAEIAIAGTLCLVRESISGTFLANAFPGLGFTSDQWYLTLSKLGPLVIEREGGFHVLHNDVRVFLANYFSERGEAQRRWVAGCLVDHYCSLNSNRKVAHVSLFQLLRTAGRDNEWARVFDNRWVFEAVALGESFQEVSLQCKAALSAAIALQDWDILHQVACATETLERWENYSRGASTSTDDRNTEMAPFFPPSELVVLPTDSWTIDSLRGVTTDAARIAKAGETDRANALLRRWFSGMTIGELAMLTYPSGEKSELDDSNVQSADSWFCEFGDVSRSLNFLLGSDDEEHPMHNRAEYHYEEGWAAASCRLGPFDSVSSCFNEFSPRYYPHIETSVRILADLEEWKLVAEFLQHCHEERSNFTDDFKMFATWWSVKSGIHSSCPGWLESLGEKNLDLKNSGGNDIQALLAIAKSSGWLDTAGESSDLAGEIFKRTKYAIGSKTGLRVLLNAAVILGQVASLEAQGKSDAVPILFRPESIGQIANALWGKTWMDKSDPLWLSAAAGNLSLEWVKTFFPLDQAYRDALMAAGRPVAELAPQDHRVESVWLLLKLAGERDILAEWCRKAIGEVGWIWSDSSGSSDEPETMFFLEAAREIGESHLAQMAESRLKWHRLGYVCHKDYSFRWAWSWFEELSAIDASVVRNQGLRLLLLQDACDSQGGENRCFSEIQAAVGTAAIASGPADVWRVMFSDRGNREDWRWFENVKILFLDGFLDRLAQPMPEKEMIICWCMAISLARWYDAGDVAIIFRIRNAILESCATTNERQDMEDLLRRISPGEFARKPLKDDEDASGSDNRSSGEMDWREVVKSGHRLSPSTAATAVREILLTNSADQESELIEVLELFGRANSMSGGWGYFREELKKPLSDIMRSVPDRMLWYLAKSAILRVDEGGYWYSSVCENLQALLLTRASILGHDELESGLGKVLDMHERLARGGDLSATLPEIAVADVSRCKTWEGLACETFAVLFSSRYGAVLESACTGLNAFVSWKPEIIPKIFESFGDDSWRVRWLLGLTEVWSIKFPDELNRASKDLASFAKNGSLSIRLQAWITQILMAKNQDGLIPLFEFIASNSGEDFKPVGGHDILETGFQMHGAFRLVDGHKYAQSSINRVEHTTGEDFRDVRFSVGPKLIQAGGDNASDRSWPERIKNDHDWECRGEHKDLTLDQEFDRVIVERVDSPGSLLRFAQGHLPCEEGWVLHRTPMPHPLLAAWPSERSLEGAYNQPPSSRKILDTLRPLALEGIYDDEVVLAACLEASSWRDHFKYEYWFQESEDATTANAGMPTTLNGRTFAWMAWNDWYEPRQSKGTRSICFSVQGQQKLLNAFPKLFPSKIWITKLGWMPSDGNPFEWLSKAQPAVRYEILHGPLQAHSTNASRLQTVHRWVAKSDAFKNAMETMPLLKVTEKFTRIAVKGE